MASKILSYEKRMSMIVDAICVSDNRSMNTRISYIQMTGSARPILGQAYSDSNTHHMSNHRNFKKNIIKRGIMAHL